jgi:hypothetical protein
MLLIRQLMITKEQMFILSISDDSPIICIYLNLKSGGGLFKWWFLNSF